MLQLLLLLKAGDSHYIPTMKLPRFRLSTLLLLITAMAAVLGYSQVRRHRLNREFAALAAQGVPRRVPGPLVLAAGAGVDGDHVSRRCA